MMKTYSLRFWWITLLLGATLLRLPFPDWDGGIAAHPDERFLLGVAQETPLWGDVCAASPDFAYGHLPVYVARLLVLTAPQADPLYAARLLSGLIGVALVALTGAFGRALGGERAGLLAAAVLMFAPFPIQQARFYTVDPFGAALASGAILAAMRKRWSTAGALTGLALACKASLGWAAVAVVVGYGLWVWQGKGRGGGGERGSRG
ncbi:MAG TPA: phospholipid carrier-dependent glycosyltransferase, partial [Anaerolineae bacterium]|nr:phospholipid carrier-dependent glycosyltransferase [Anaerolineae bacterium]